MTTGRASCFQSLTCVLVLLATAPTVAQEEAIDFQRARQLRDRMRRGETLTQPEQQYLDRARQQIQQRGARRPTQSSMSLTPLTDMTAEARYKGEDGGLYGEGKNDPPPNHLQAAMQQARRIAPLDAAGKPSPDGKIGVVSIGMSNTTQEFSALLALAGDDRAIASAVVLVDGAQGGMEALAWGDPSSVQPASRNPWSVLEARLKQAGVSPHQVQVVWMKQARRSPASQGEYPKHAEEMKRHMVSIVSRLEETFPNLRIIYLSSRIYAGYAQTDLNPEPYAYETAFVVRDLIQDQIAARSAADDQRAENQPADAGAAEPVLLWGPYLWANGVEGRKVDDLVWQPEDLAADGTHPSDRGRRKVAQLLLDFFKNVPTARPWFVR